PITSVSSPGLASSGSTHSQLPLRQPSSSTTSPEIRRQTWTPPSYSPKFTQGLPSTSAIIAWTALRSSGSSKSIGVPTLQFRRPIPDHAGHLGEDVLRARAGLLEDLVAVVGRVEEVERGAAAEL